MTTISLREQTNCRPSTPRSSICVPVCHYRQKVTKGFHLSGVGNVSCNLLPLAGVSLLSRENSYIEHNKSTAPEKKEVQGDIKVNREIRSGKEGTRDHKSVEDSTTTVKEGALSVVGERLNSLSSLSCAFGTTPLIRMRKHTPDIQKPEMAPVGPDALSGKSISSLECNSPVLTPGVPPCSPIHNYPSTPVRRFASSPVKQFTLDGIKICGLAVSKSASQPRDFISGKVRKVTYCCDKCELRMAEHEALLMERAHSVSYHRYTPSSCQSNNPPIKSSTEHRRSSNELYDLQDLSKMLKYGREQQENREAYMQNRVKQNQSERRLQSKGDTNASDESKRDKSKNKEMIQSEHSRQTQETSSSCQKGVKDKKPEENQNHKCEKKEESILNTKNNENFKTENKSHETTIAEKSVTGNENPMSKVRINKETQTPGIEPERKELLSSGATGSETSKCSISDSEHKQKEDSKELEFKSEKYQSDSNLEMKMKMCREQSASNTRKCNSDMFSETEALQDFFSSFKEKLLRLPKILNDLKLSNDSISLNSSTTEDAVSSSETSGERSSDARKQNSRDCSSRLMGITSREQLQQILQDCEDVINDTPGSFLPDISTPSCDICYTAMIDKRYNRWKNRKRRKAKRYTTSPTESSSEEDRVGSANNTATPIERESEQRTCMRIRRRRREADDETHSHSVIYDEEYLHYDGSAEVTTSSSSDRDGKHSQFRVFVQNKQCQKQQQLSQNGPSNSSTESSVSEKISVILNDKDEWKAWDEMRSEKKGLVTDTESENQPLYSNKPVAPPLISNSIIESPYVAAKDISISLQRPSLQDKVKKNPPLVPIERASKNLKIENESSDKIDTKLSNEGSNRKIKFSRKTDVVTVNDHGLFTNQMDINSQKLAGNRKQAEAFARKQRKNIGELAWTGREKIYPNVLPKSPQNAFDNGGSSEKIFKISNTMEKKRKLKEKPSQEQEDRNTDTSSTFAKHSVQFKNLPKNDKKPKQKKSSGLDRRKCINTKKESLPMFKPPKPPQQQRPQSHQNVKKEMSRTLTSLSFSPAFTFSFFELPREYKNSNCDLSRRASTAFSKISLSR